MNVTTTNVIPECKGSIPMFILPKDRTVFDCQIDTFVFPDVLPRIFLQCAFKGGITTAVALSCTSKYHYNAFKAFADQKIPLTDFFQALLGRCAKLTIWDPESFQHTSALSILLADFDYLNHVENDAGGVAFCYEDLSMPELIAWGKSLGVFVDARDDRLEKDALISEEQPQICIATNGIFNNSRNKKALDLKCFVENEQKCQMFTARKALYFALRTIALSKGATFVFGKNPKPTYTCTSTPYGDPMPIGDLFYQSYLVIGGSGPARFDDDDDFGGEDCGEGCLLSFRVDVDDEAFGVADCGAGGLLSFSAPLVIDAPNDDL